jgi:hypothetical protein
MTLLSTTKPNPGDEANSTDISTPLTQIETWANGGVDDTNISGISGSKIAGGTVTTTQLQDLAVTTGKLAAGAVTNAKLGTGATTLGYHEHAGTTLTTAYVTHSTVTATSIGSAVRITVNGYIYNANSGAARTYDIKLICDSVTVKEMTSIHAPYISGQNVGHWFSYTFSHTPSAASHVWELQLKASLGTSVVVGSNTMEVREVK